MKFSLITATYNSLSSIHFVLDSVKKQTHKEIEWIIVDGSSTDGTLDYIKENEHLIDKYVSEKDNGIYDALNKGISMASGDVIGFLHSDDFLASSGIIASINEAFNKKPVDGVYGDLEYVEKENTHKVVRYWKSKIFKPDLLNEGWMPAHPTVFLKREVYLKHGFFNTDLKISADYDFMLRIFNDQSLSFVYLPQLITKMRVGGASNRNLKNIIQKSKEDLWALRANKISYPYKALMTKNFSKISQFVKKNKD